MKNVENDAPPPFALPDLCTCTEPPSAHRLEMTDALFLLAVCCKTPPRISGPLILKTLPLVRLGVTGRAEGLCSCWSLCVHAHRQIQKRTCHTYTQTQAQTNKETCVRTCQNARARALVLFPGKAQSHRLAAPPDPSPFSFCKDFGWHRLLT